MDPSNIHHTLNGTIGALLVGFMVAAALYGINCAQCAVFFYRGPLVPLKLRSIIFVLWMLETLHLCLYCHALYFYIAARHGDLSILVSGTWSLLIQVLPTILITVIVQNIWIWRIWTLNRSAWRTTIATVMVTLSLAGCILYITWLGRRYPQKKRTDDARNPLYLTSLGFVVLNDSLSNFTLCFLLHRSKTGLRRADSSLTILMAYALNTGLLTFIGSLSTLLLIYFTPYKFYFIAVNAISTKLYLNSLLSMLSWRRSPKQSAGDARHSVATEYPTVQLTSVYGPPGSDSDFCEDRMA